MSEPMDDKEVAGVTAHSEAIVSALADFLSRPSPQLDRCLHAISEGLEKLAVNVFPLVKLYTSFDWETINKRLEELPQKSREAMELASKQGWFFNWRGSLQCVVELTEKLHAAADAKTIDTILTQHYTESWDFYLGLLAADYPERIGVIRAATKSHREQKEEGFALSVPVFLAQADGILGEISGVRSPMGKRRNTPFIRGSEWVLSQIGDDVEATKLLFPILQLHELDILKSEAEREVIGAESGHVFDSLNRHQVLHGEVSDYGTEQNSLKAFSFLAFVALHVPEIIASAKERNALAQPDG